MNTQRLKTAASCTEHDERTYACLNCGKQVTRKACETWHQDQCDDCIVLWAYDKAVRDADKAINDGAPEHLLRWHTDNVREWREDCEKRGLLQKSGIRK